MNGTNNRSGVFTFMVLSSPKQRTSDDIGFVDPNTDNVSVGSYLLRYLLT